MPEKTAPDLSEFFKYSKPKKPPCRVGFALSQLKPKERSELIAALEMDNNIITNGAIAEWLEKRGQDGPSTSALTSHRKGKCNCAED